MKLLQNNQYCICWIFSKLIPKINMMSVNYIGLTVLLKLQQSHSSQDISIISSSMNIDYEGKRRTACISFLTSCSTEKHAFAGYRHIPDRAFCLLETL